MKRIFSILFAVVLVVSFSLIPSALVGASPGPGLVGEWHFDEGSGTTASDSSGYGNDGTIYGATYVGDKLGLALSFDGTDDYVEVADSASLDIGTGDFTIEAWIKLATTANDYYGIYDKGKGRTSGEGRYSLFVTPSDTLRLHIYGQSGSENAYYDSTLTVDDTNWHYVAVSADRDGNAIFAIDSSTETVDISGSSSYDVSSTYDAAIGVRQWDTGDHWFPGLIDEVRIWDTAHPPLHVDDDGNQYATPYTTIQAAVDAATTGDTIIVHEGTYAGFNANVEGITVKAALGETPVISGTGISWDGVAVGVVVTADDVTIQGLKLTAQYYIGIWVEDDADDVQILDNTINNFNRVGILVGDVDSVQIEGNTISTTDYGDAPNGIQIANSSGITGTIKNNQISGCHWNGYDPQTETYEGEWTGSGILIIDAASSLTISGNEVQNSDVGLDIEAGSGTAITNNDVHDNSYGFVSWNADPTINYNSISGNSRFGVYRTYDLTDTLDATKNWWGDKRGPSRAMGKAKGHDEVKGDRVSPNVRFAPWLRAEAP